MPKSRAQLERAARRINAILEKYLATLPVEEQEARTRAFERIVAKVSGTRAKRAKPLETRASGSSRRMRGSLR